MSEQTPQPELEPPPAPPKRRRKLTRRRKLVFGLFLACTLLLGSEGVLRLLGYPKGLMRSAKRLWATDTEQATGWFRPSVEVRISWPPELAYTVKTNALGLRGPAPAGGLPLVLCLGDSTTFGSYVADDEAYPFALGERLASERLGVLNAGCPHTTLSDQYEVLERSLETLKPRVVVLLFCGNDLYELEKSPAKARALKRRNPISDLASSLAISDAAISLTLSARHSYLRAKGPWPVPLRPDQGRTAGDSDERWERYERELARTLKLTRSKGAKLILCAFPGYLEIAEAEPCEIETRLPAMAARAGVSYVDLYAPFRAAKEQKLYLLPHDAHASAIGNRLVAKTLAKAVLEAARSKPEGE